MATGPQTERIAPALLRLEPFDPRQAELVASWVNSELEAYWLAPQTPPPLTAEQIRRWSCPGHEPFLLCHDRRPVAYGELNLLNALRATYWLGHLLVDPALRGRGIGRELTRRLVHRARICYGASQVSLVVFPANLAAIACYRAAGMVPDGYELHELRPYRQRVRLLRMSIRFF